MSAEHVIDENVECWCGPARICAECEGEVVSPCIHGSERPEVVIHKEAA